MSELLSVSWLLALLALVSVRASRKFADCIVKVCIHWHAVLWFVYMLIYGVFPLNLSQGIYHLFAEVLATSATFWLLIILAPVACVLPGYLWRQLRT